MIIDMLRQSFPATFWLACVENLVTKTGKHGHTAPRRIKLELEEVKKAANGGQEKKAGASKEVVEPWLALTERKTSQQTSEGVVSKTLPTTGA